jgi:hypothetical protein
MAIGFDLDIKSVMEIDEVSRTKDLFVIDHDGVTRVDAVSINEDRSVPSRWYLGRTVLGVARGSGHCFAMSGWLALAHTTLVSVARRQQSDIYCDKA